MTTHRNGLMIAISVFLFMSASAHAEGFFLGFSLGGGDADIDVPIFSSGDEFSFDNESGVLAADVFAGYEFSNDVFIEVSLQGYDNFNVTLFDDDLELSVVEVGVGYYFPSESKLRFFAGGGLAIWDLEARESLVFNPGPEEEVGLDGTDFFIEGGTEYRFNDWFRMGVTLSHSELDFGSAQSIELTFKFVPQ